MCRNKDNPCGDDEFAAWDGQEKDLSVSLTVRWSRKRKRWESDNAFFLARPKGQVELPQQ